MTTTENEAGIMEELEAPTAPEEEAPAGSGRSRGASVVLLLVLAAGSLGVGFVFGKVLRPAPAPVPTPVAVVFPDAPAAAPLVPEQAHPLQGRTAPDFRLTDLATGQDVRLEDYKGRPVLVNFWATWCPPCRMEMPWLEAAHERHAAEGLTILAVNAGERVPAEMVHDTIQQYVASAGLTFPILVGDAAGPLQSAWGVYGLPSSFIIDREGTITDVNVGMYPSQQVLEDKLAAVIGDGAG